MEVKRLVIILMEFACYNEEVKEILIEEIKAFVDEVLPEKLPYDEQTVEMGRILKVVE